MFDIGHLFLICHIYAPMKRVQDIPSSEASA